MRIVPQVVQTREQRAKLEAYARGRKTPARVVLRARIVLHGVGQQDSKGNNCEHFSSYIKYLEHDCRQQYRQQYVEGAATGEDISGSAECVRARLYGSKLASRLRAIPSFFIRK